jgi:hypothetical protein
MPNATLPAPRRVQRPPPDAKRIIVTNDPDPVQRHDAAARLMELLHTGAQPAFSRQEQTFAELPRGS